MPTAKLLLITTKFNENWAALFPLPTPPLGGSGKNTTLIKDG